MDATLFTSSYDDIVALNATEGPNTNIWEPKFTAREQMQKLLETIANMYTEGKSQLALRQACMCYTFVASNMREVEEEQEGVVVLQRAYRLLHAAAAEEFPDSVATVEPWSLEEMIAAAGEHHFLQVDRGFLAVVEYMWVHNTLGLYLSSGRGGDARKVLHAAEAAYKDWDTWAKGQPVTYAVEDLKVSDAGKLQVKEEMTEDQRSAYWERFRMTCAHTSNLFYLAQAYTTIGEAATASRYCHMTMYYHLFCRQEFASKVWAGNALQLSGFYSGHFEYDKAFHCLQAGEKVMAAEKAGEEDTTGVVAWAYGRYYLHRLDHYSNILQGCEPEETATIDTSYWVDFPGMPPLEEQAPITTFEQAREEFKAGHKWLRETLEHFPFESSCTRHIEVVQDISRLYAALALFETNRGRLIAMVQRQIDLTESIPGQLNFNSYPTVVRQLLYDLGYLHEDLLRLRTEQRKKPEPNEKPLKDKAFNALVSKTLDFYNRFIETWRLPTTKEIPAVIDEDSRLPFFRALMRIAQTQISFAHASAKEEYDGIGKATAAYQRAYDFSEQNPLPESTRGTIERERELAKEMIKLLPVKQRDLWMAYQRSQH